MRIHFVTAELAPLCQSGGLGEAVSGLARALGARGHHVTCVVPGYRDAFESHHCPRLRQAGDVTIALPGGELRGTWWTGELFHGVSVAFLDVPELYRRSGLYGDGESLYADNHLRFITLARAAAYRAEADRSDVLVAHDHHAALALCVLRTSLDRGPNRGMGAVQVVHNNAYQGRYEAEAFAYTGLARELFHPDGLEAYGSLCCLKGGIEWADRVVTVSPTYASEVQDAGFGEGLEGLYQRRAHRLSGIVNGVDVQRFDPRADPALVAHFDHQDLEGKRRCRRALLDELGLAAPPDGLLCVGIGRFAEQKGWDVILDAAPSLLELGATLAFLGDGDPNIASSLNALARAHPGRVAVRSVFDDALARRLYAGGDCVLVPSRFEPCGLVQRIAQRYGTVPVAHAVGGLVDTIVDPELLYSGNGGHHEESAQTGVLFAPLTPRALRDAVARVRALAERGGLDALRARLLTLDVSWSESAARWEEVLESAAAEARSRL